MARSAGLEPTASASAGLRSIQLSYERAQTHRTGNSNLGTGLSPAPSSQFRRAGLGAEGGI